MNFKLTQLISSVTTTAFSVSDSKTRKPTVDCRHSVFEVIGERPRRLTSSLALLSSRRRVRLRGNGRVHRISRPMLMLMIFRCV